MQSPNEKALWALDRILVRLREQKDEAASVRDWELWHWYHWGEAEVMRMHVETATKLAKARVEGMR